jgi:aminotransferase EvaB
MNHKVPLNRLTSARYSRNPQLLETIGQVIDSGFWINGPQQKTFELSLASSLNVGSVQGVANGSDALEISMRALGINSESCVAMAANAGGYALVAARNIGCEIIFLDIRLDNGLIDLEDLKEVTKQHHLDLVVLTYLFGNTKNATEIINFLTEISTPILEDCAQALGSKVGNSFVGSLGAIASFSFYPTKNLGAIGDAGAIATSNSELARKVTEIRQYGWTSRYRIGNTSGMNSRLDEIQAAVLNYGFPFVEEDSAARRKILNFYKSSHSFTNFEFVTESDISSTAHLAVILLHGVSRGEAEKIMNNRGIETGIHYPVLDCDQKAGHKSVIDRELPNSRMWVKNILTIPCFSSMSDDEVQHVAATLREIG